MKNKHKVLTVLALAMITMFTVMGLCGCEEDGEPSVVMIGDSLLDMSGCLPGVKAIRRELQELSGHRYESYDKSGARLVEDMIPIPMPIPKQYDRAREENDSIDTIILSGGANDILINRPVNCTDFYFGDSCKEFIDGISGHLESLVSKMIDDGIKNIVYVSYLNGSGFDLSNKAIAYSTDKARGIMSELDGTNGAKIKFVDPKPFQMEHPDVHWLCMDYTHPTKTAAVYLAEHIWDTMVENDMPR